MLLLDPAPLLAALLLALALDALLGDPAWLYRRLPHPVVADRPRDSPRSRRAGSTPPPRPRAQRRRGSPASLLVLAASAAAGLALQTLCLLLPHGWLALGLLMSTPARLARPPPARRRGRRAASTASLAAGRRAVARIVGRDPESLDRHAVARAAIESTAENFADGVMAPLALGPPARPARHAGLQGDQHRRTA